MNDFFSLLVFCWCHADPFWFGSWGLNLAMGILNLGQSFIGVWLSNICSSKKPSSSIFLYFPSPTLSLILKSAFFISTPSIKNYFLDFFLTFTKESQKCSQFHLVLYHERTGLLDSGLKFWTVLSQDLNMNRLVLSTYLSSMHTWRNGE